jgi:hypothetical protein
LKRNMKSVKEKMTLVFLVRLSREGKHLIKL